MSFSILKSADKKDKILQSRNESYSLQIEKSGNSEPEYWKERNKFRILRNNLKFLIICNLVPLALLCFSINYHCWYLIYDSDKKSVWISLLNVYNSLTGEYTPISIFMRTKCKTVIHAQNCSFLVNFTIAGIIAFLFISLGLVLQFINLIQLFLILFNKQEYLKSKLCLKTGTSQHAIIFLYIGSLVFWMVTSGILIRKWTNIGICFYLTVLSNMIYLGLVIYYNRLQNKVREANMVNALLNADSID